MALPEGELGLGLGLGLEGGTCALTRKLSKAFLEAAATIGDTLEGRGFFTEAFTLTGASTELGAAAASEGLGVDSTAACTAFRWNRSRALRAAIEALVSGMPLGPLE